MENNNQKIEAKIDGIVFCKGKTEAVASVTFGEGVAIHGIYVTDVDGNINISIPQAACPGNGEADVAITEEVRAAIIHALDLAYAQRLEEQQAQEVVGPNEGMTM